MAQPKPGGLAMGYRFEPSDEDLIDFYLRTKKIYGDQCVVPDCLIKDLDIYQHNPDELPQGGAVFPYRHSNEMYFFTPRHPTTPGSKRVNRRAGDGLWDGHAKNVAIEKNGKVIGHKAQLHFKILVDGDNNKKIPTNWIMNEYCLGSDKNGFDALVLCKIYKKSEKGAEGEESAAASSSSSYCAALDYGQEQEQDSETLPKRQRMQDPAPLACIPADYQQRSLPSFVSMMNEATAGCWTSFGATALLDSGDHAPPTSASTSPLLRPADCGGAFAQLPTNTPTEQSLAATGAEYQVSTEKVGVHLLAEPESSNGAGNLREVPTDEEVAAFTKFMDSDPTKEPIDKDKDGNTEFIKAPAFMNSLPADDIEEPGDEADDLAAYAKYLEAYISEETLASREAGNQATPSSSQNMSLPLEGAHEPSPLRPPVGSNCGSSSAPTVPMAVVPDDHHVSAQAQVNAMSKEPSTSCDAETQTQTMGSVAGEVPNDFTSPPSLDYYDWNALVSSMKDFDNTCFTIDELLGVIKSCDV